MCTPATRGVWMDLLCAMHQSGRSGELRGTTDQIARLARSSTAELTQALTELQTTGTADVTFRNKDVTVINRKMKREAKDRAGTALRVMKHRSNAECNGTVTPEKIDVRRQKTEEEIQKAFLSWNHEKLNFFQDGGWQISFSSKKNIKISEVQRFMNEFIGDIELKEDYKSKKELQRHFTNWYNLKKAKGAAGQQVQASSGPPLKKIDNGIS
jgi:hypothetical protein